MALRKKNEDALLIALACGATVEAAAKQCGVHDRTVYRRMADPEFQTQLKAIRSDMVRRAAGNLTAAAGEAVRTLLALLKEPTPHATRLGAARAILEIGMKVREIAEIEADMRELEKQVESIKGSGNGRYPRVVP